MNGLYALPIGVDFAETFVDGLLARLEGPPDAMARVTVYLNSGQTLTAVKAAFDRRAAAGRALFLPRLRLLSEVGQDGAPASPLARQLRLGHLLRALMAREPDLGAGQSVPQLAASLAELMAEMQTEGRSAADLAGVDVGAHAEHWGRALRFLNIAAEFYLEGERTDREARLYDAARAARAAWPEGRDLPDGPVIVAGSTGSHGATRLFMEAVARLPQGAVVLPGYDFDLSPEVWATLDDDAQDHPQHRFAALMQALDQDPARMRVWHEARPPRAAFNKVMSLALRPAPVTDQWIDEGPALGDLVEASAHVSLIEADTPAAEAESIALLMRDALAQNRPVTLVAADGLLIRRVNAALDRWRILPDESAGRRLDQTAVGLLLRQTAGLFGRMVTADMLIGILKHPLVASGGDRGTHLLELREYELSLRRYGPAYPDGASLRQRAERARDAAGQEWALWLADWLDLAARAAEDHGPRPLADRIAAHLTLTERLCDGPAPVAVSQLWQKDVGGKARAVMDHLIDHAADAYEMTPRDYSDLLTGQLRGLAERADVTAHPLVRIRGPREARSEAARGDGGITILAGLNEGGWPVALAPDPWLSRQMRRAAGLTLPERRIGLAAHDFQQGAGAAELVLTRARRDAEAETIPSRWLNRLLNLMGGLPSNGGAEALARMRARGDRWLHYARVLAAPKDPVRAPPRPAPVPPPGALTRLNVTEVERLIRAPYDIYARRVLNLSPLDPLRASADYRLRGTVMHQIIERFLTPPPDLADGPAAWRARFLRISHEVLDQAVPWPTARLIWQAQLEDMVARVIDEEIRRLTAGRPVLLEEKGGLALGETGVRLAGQPDRVDLRQDGLWIYDYKSGKAPTQQEVNHFSLQLPILAAMAEQGGFGALPANNVAGASYIVLKPSGKNPAYYEEERELPPQGGAAFWADLAGLVMKYQNGEVGFTARLALQSTSDFSDYDQLSRFGEWSLSDPAVKIKVGQP